MADLVWPVTWAPEQDSSKYTVEDVSQHSNYDDGVHAGRRKWTKSRKTFTLSFQKMPDADHTALLNFYENVVYGGSLPFTWMCPWDDKQYTVYFSDYSDFVPTYGNGENRWSGTVKLTEAY